MGSKLPGRWPNGAERHRKDIYATAADARIVLDGADSLIERLAEAVRDYNKPLIAQLCADLRAHHADTRSMLSDIQRWAVEAKVGTDDAETNSKPAADTAGR